MATLPEVKVKIGADTKDFDRGIQGVQSRLSTFAKVGVAGAVAAIGSAGVAMAAMTRASLDNIDALTKQARSLGLTTSAFQKMTLVAGEAGIEAGKLSSMLGLMQRNIDGLAEGTEAQVRAFGALGLSISELQGLSPDEQFERIAASLDKISDPTEKTARAMDIFGRSGRDAINMLSDYSAKAAEAERFQLRFGVAVDQTTAEGVERANDAVGRLGMVMDGLGNKLAGAVAPAIEATANALISFAANVMGVRVELDQFFGSLENAKAMLGEDLFAKIFNDPRFLMQHAVNLEAIVVEMESIATVAATAAPQLRIFADELEDLGEDEAAETMRALADEIVKANSDLENKIITIEEFNEKMAEIAVKSRDVVNEFERINGANFSTAFANIATLTQRLWDAAAAAAAARANMEAALMDQSPAGEAMRNYAGRGTTSDRPVEHGTVWRPVVGGPGAKPRSAPSELGLEAPPSGGKGGGGGVKDMFAERLAQLEEGLRTEAEVIAAWYEEGILTLEGALERGHLTEEKYREMRERLEQEHQDRLAQIRELGNESAVSMALGAGQEILNAIGQTNKEALRIAKVFGAAQALISAYQGAAEALKMPFPKNLAAAATVLAKGIGFVNAISSVSDSGGGRGAAGAAASSAGAASIPVQRMVIETQGGGLVPQASLGSIIDQINEAGRRGFRIDAQFVQGVA